jgi:predicted O-methyltransferase YrrM
VADKVNVYVGDSADVLVRLPEVYDLVFIDGSHDRESVLRDADLAVRHVLKPGGVLVFHDYRSSQDPGVTEAVDELIAGGGELLSRCGTLAVVRPPAAALAGV